MSNRSCNGIVGNSDVRQEEQVQMNEIVAEYPDTINECKADDGQVYKEPDRKCGDIEVYDTTNEEPFDAVSSANRNKIENVLSASLSDGTRLETVYDPRSGCNLLVIDRAGNISRHKSYRDGSII